MSSIQIGRVVAGGKLHLVVRGQSNCPVAAYRTITAPAKPSAVEPSTVCGHCKRNANLVRVEQANSRNWIPAIDAMLERLATTAAQTRSAELAARWHTAQPVEVVKPRSLADLRSAYAHTHKQPAGHVPAVKLAA